MVRVVEPEEPGDAIGVPRGKQARRDADEVVEDGHADGEDKGGAVGQQDEENPGAPAEGRVLVAECWCWCRERRNTLTKTSLAAVCE